MDDVKMISVYKNGIWVYLMYVDGYDDEDTITLMLQEHVAEDDGDYIKDNYSWKFVEDY